MQVGQRLKELRKRHNLSQRALSRLTGVSHSTLSLIEQERMSPSVGMLKTILDGFPMSLAEFFDPPPNADTEQIFFRDSELSEIASGSVTLRQVGANLKGKPIQILHEVFLPGASSGEKMLSHQGFEGGMVIKGRLEVTVEDRVCVLNQNDAYYFESTRPHRFRNVGDDICEYISACSPPTF